MHSINLYVMKVAEPPRFPHVMSGKWCLLPITDGLVKASKADIMDDDYLRDVERYMLHNVAADCTMARVETDYFGGAGEQSAKSWLHEYTQEHERINDALKRIGVSAPNKDTKDEFDAIRLGRYRQNEDVVEEWMDIHGKTTERSVQRLVLRHLPREIEIMHEEVRAYFNEHEYYAEKQAPESGYYSVVSDVQYAAGRMITKETRKRCDKGKFDLAMADAASVAKVCYWDDAYYTFKCVRSMGLSGTTIVTAEVYEGSSVHEQVDGLVLMKDDEFIFSEYSIGMTGKPPRQRQEKIKKKTIEVYDCPVCNAEGSMYPIHEMPLGKGRIHLCKVCNHSLKIEVNAV